MIMCHHPKKQLFYQKTTINIIDMNIVQVLKSTIIDDPSILSLFFFLSTRLLFIKPKWQITREIDLSNPHYILDFTISPIAQIVGAFFEYLLAQSRQRQYTCHLLILHAISTDSRAW